MLRSGFRANCVKNSDGSTVRQTSATYAVDTRTSDGGSSRRGRSAPPSIPARKLQQQSGIEARVLEFEGLASHSEIKAQYRSASIRKNWRVVFNIKGNEYRLVVAIAYRLQIVYVKFIGTHEQYDAIDAHTIEPI